MVDGYHSGDEKIMGLLEIILRAIVILKRGNKLYRLGDKHYE